MDEETLDAIAGTLTAHGFILENLYALVLAQDRDPVTACRRTGAELMRQFEDLPPNNADEIDGEKAFRVTQHGLHRLERFFASIEDRLRKGTD